MTRPDDPWSARVLSGAHAIDFDEALGVLGDRLPLLYRLADTPQEPAWHAEGDVATHTRMVCEALETSIHAGTHAAPDGALGHTRLAALLHDLAKPLTTRRAHRHGTERIISPRHAERGASIVAYQGLDLGWSATDVLAIAALIRHHHDPRRLIHDGAQAGAYRQLARGVPARALYDLIVADMRGRICADQESQLTDIELFRLGCEEAGVWNDAHAREQHEAFVDHIAHTLDGLDPRRIMRGIAEGVRAWDRGQIYTPHEAVSQELARGARVCHVVLTCGPSGSGKSHIAQTHFEGYEVISLDAIRAEIAGNARDQSRNDHVLVLARERLRQHLRDQRDVVWDATSLLRDFRAPVLGLTHDYHATTTIALALTPPSQCFARNSERDHPVPAAILTRQLDQFMWPSVEEAHEVRIFSPAEAV